MLLSPLATEVMQDPGGQRICHLSIFPFIPDPPQLTPGSRPASSFQHCQSPLTESLALVQLPLPPFYFKDRDRGHNVRSKQDSFGNNSERSGHTQPLPQGLKGDSYPSSVSMDISLPLLLQEDPASDGLNDP